MHIGTFQPSPGVDRHRNRRGSPSSLIEPLQQNGGGRGSSSQYYGTVAARSDNEDFRGPGGTLRKLSDPQRQRPASTVYFNEQYGTVGRPPERSMTPEPRFPQLEAPPLDDAYRSRTLGRSSHHMSSDPFRAQSRRLGRHSNSMHQLNEVGRSNVDAGRKYGGPRADSREHFVPIQFEGGTARRRRVQSMENLLQPMNDEPPRQIMERQVPVHRAQEPPRRPAPVRQLPGELGMGPLRRSRSDMGDRQKMQGFSYLYPDKPVVDKVSPVPTNESSRDSGWGTEQQTPPSRSTYQRRPASGGGSRPGPHGHVTYIPIRVQGGEANGSSGVEMRERPAGRSRGYYDDSSARSSLTTAPDSALDGSLGYAGGSSIEHSPVRQRPQGQYTRRVRPGDGRRSGVPDDVEDALRKFDYLNEYSDRGSSYAAFNR